MNILWGIRKTYDILSYLCYTLTRLKNCIIGGAVMNIEHVISFIETIKLGSISAAAARCNLSQSALSQQIKSLEKSFNAKLLVRSHNGIVPTSAGTIAFKHFSSILDSYNSMISEIDSMNTSCETVKILSTAFACAYALPCTFYHFKNKYSGYSLEIETATSNVIEEKITNGNGDLGIVIGQPKDKRLHAEKVFTDEFFLVCSQSFDIPKSITKEDIYKYPFVMLTNNHRTQQILAKQLSVSDIDCNRLNMLYSVDTAESMKLSVINGFGVAFLPYMAIKKELYHKQLRLVTCSDLKLEGDYYAIKQRENTGLCLGKDKVVQYIEKILSHTIC